MTQYKRNLKKQCNNENIRSYAEKNDKVFTEKIKFQVYKIASSVLQ